MPPPRSTSPVDDRRTDAPVHPPTPEQESAARAAVHRWVPEADRTRVLQHLGLAPYTKTPTCPAGHDISGVPGHGARAPRCRKCQRGEAA